MSTSLPAIGICGAGQMGAAAAVSFRRAGYPVLLGEHDAAKVPRVHQRLADLEAWMDQHVEAAPAPSASIDVTRDLDVIDQRSDVIMDAIVEVREEKVALLRRMNTARERGVIFLSTTSGLPITDLGRGSGTGSQLVGTHFWNPPHLMPLVEVVRGAESDPAIVDRVCELMKSMRMPAVGPLENMDLVGLDLIRMIHQYLPADLCNAGGPLPLLEQKVRKGETFHDWPRDGLAKLAERRDRQIVHQLAFLKELDAL